MEPSAWHRWTNFVTSCALDQSVDHLCHQGSNLSHCRQLPQPPTATAAKFHSYRAYLAVQQWIGNKLCPTDWGWQYRDGGLVPLTTDQRCETCRAVARQVVGRHADAERQGCTVHPCAVSVHGQTCNNIHALVVSHDSDMTHRGVNATTLVT